MLDDIEMDSKFINRLSRGIPTGLLQNREPSHPLAYPQAEE